MIYSLNNSWASEFWGRDEGREITSKYFLWLEGTPFIYIQFVFDSSFTYALIHLFISMDPKQPRKRQTDIVSFLAQEGGGQSCLVCTTLAFLILLRIHRAPSHRATLNYRRWDDEWAIHPSLPLDRHTVLNLCVNYSPGSWGIGQVNVTFSLKVLSVLGVGSFQGSKKPHTEDSVACPGAGWIQSLDLELQPIQISIEMLENSSPGSKTKQAFSFFFFSIWFSMILFKWKFLYSFS